MKRIMILTCVLLLMPILASCAGNRNQEQTMHEQTGYTLTVPAAYTKASTEPGAVVRVDYDSKDYVRDEASVTKTAYVYTPYGYDENDTDTRYNILYLMHGWGGHAGEYFEYGNLKNVFDNLIEKGEIQPLIIVSATFYNPNSSTDFSSSVAEFHEFHRDFEENLMPAVEGGFHTYAQSVSLEDLKGYNAFALIYRPGAQTACEDLARAIAFIFENAEELEVNIEDYSLWGGSAGARMAAWLGSYGTESFGEREYPRPVAVIMQYTGLSEVYGNEPPTYNCVGISDGIASFRTMQRRIEAIRGNGTDAEIEVFDGLSHGFGLGTGTAAEGWIDHAVAFWERNMKGKNN